MRVHDLDGNLVLPRSTTHMKGVTMTDDEPYLGSGDHPLSVGRYWQAPNAARLPLPGGGYTRPHKLYLIGIFPSSEYPVVCGGPYRTDLEVEAALRTVVLYSAPAVEQRREA